MPADRIHVLHLCSNSVTQMGILRSQVAVPMRQLASDERLKITIVSGERMGERDSDAENALLEDVMADGVDLSFFEKAVGPALRTKRPSPVRRALAPLYLWRDVKRMSRFIERFAMAHQPCVIHARSYIPAWAALRARESCRFQFLFDPRGILPEELAFAQGWTEKSRRYRWWKDLERKLVAECDTLIALTPQMAEHYRHISDAETLVIPCCVDCALFHVSTRTFTESEPLELILLIGVDVPYQAIEQALAIREALIDLWPGGAMLRVVSPDAEAMRERHGGCGLRFESPEREEIPRLLAQSDIGLLSRAPSVISRVASPVKFGEYLAAGLPVIAAAGIGECDDLLAQSECGVSLDPLKPETWREALRPFVERLRSDGPAMRQRALRLAEDHFEWVHYLPLLRRAYGLSE